MNISSLLLPSMRGCASTVKDLDKIFLAKNHQRRKKTAFDDDATRLS